MQAQTSAIVDEPVLKTNIWRHPPKKSGENRDQVNPPDANANEISLHRFSLAKISDRIAEPS